MFSAILFLDTRNFWKQKKLNIRALNNVYQIWIYLSDKIHRNINRNVPFSFVFRKI